MKMKTIGIVMMMLISVSAFSQRDMSQRGNERAPISSEQFATMQTEKMSERLNLTAAQQLEIKELFKQQADERKAMRDSQRELRKEREAKRGDRSSMRGQSVEKRAAMEAKMKEILTEEQFNTWKESKPRKNKDFDKKKRSGKKNKSANKL